MDKRNSILIIIVIILLLGGGVWFGIHKVEKEQEAKKKVEVKNEEIKKEDIIKQEEKKEAQEQVQEEKKEFVVNVDSNMDHWQTRGENEAFTIKFPKEWYWLESNHSGNEGYSRVISSNPDFDMVKYADIGIFSGYSYPLILTNDTEVVISFNGSATSDAGTPQDRIDSIFKLTKQSNPSAKCSIYNNKTIPFTVYCSSEHDYQLQQSYYVINKEISITFSARTTKDTLVKKETLDKIAKSIILK